MDDLTQIHGIGAATAKKLVKAGIDSFAKLAAATPDQLNAAKVAGGPDDWSAFITAATGLAAGPTDRQLTAEEVAALVTAWDDARAELSAAGEAVAALQSQIDSTEPGGYLAQLDTDREIARQRVATAHAVIDALRPLPEGVRLPDAKPKPEIPADAQIAGQAQQETPAVPAQPGQGFGEGTANEAPLEPGAVARASDLPDLDAMFHSELERLSAESGAAPTDIFEFAHQLLAGRDDLTNDMEAVEIGADTFSAVGFDFGRGDRHTITVIGPVGGRRRAGLSFGAVPQTVLVTKQQLALIEADGALSVSMHGTLDAQPALDSRLTVEDFDFDGKPNVSINVLGPANGRRRAGFAFGAGAQTVTVNREQLTIILADEALSVSPA